MREREREKIARTRVRESLSAVIFSIPLSPPRLSLSQRNLALFSPFTLVELDLESWSQHPSPTLRFAKKYFCAFSSSERKRNCCLKSFKWDCVFNEIATSRRRRRCCCYPHVVLLNRVKFSEVVQNGLIECCRRLIIYWTGVWRLTDGSLDLKQTNSIKMHFSRLFGDEK